jgi:hypothetical protein
MVSFKKIGLALGCLGLLVVVNGQTFKSVNSKIQFYSSAPIEDIEAINKKGVSAIDLANKSVAFSIPIDQFVFDKSLMQEHFNENYLESDKFPKSTFKGKLNGTINPGENKVTASGDLTIHGVTKSVEVPGTINWANEKLTIHAKFIVKLEDYKIKIPKAVFYNIAEEIEVTIDFEYENM